MSKHGKAILRIYYSFTEIRRTRRNYEGKSFTAIPGP